MFVCWKPERHPALSPPCTLISEQLSCPQSAQWGSWSRLLCLFGKFQDVQLNFSQLLPVCEQTLDALKAGVCAAFSFHVTKTKMCAFIYIRVSEFVQREDWNVQISCWIGFVVVALDRWRFFTWQTLIHPVTLTFRQVQTSSRLLLRRDDAFRNVHMLQMQLQESKVKPNC